MVGARSPMGNLRTTVHPCCPRFAIQLTPSLYNVKHSVDKIQDTAAYLDRFIFKFVVMFRGLRIEIAALSSIIRYFNTASIVARHAQYVKQLWIHQVR